MVAFHNQRRDELTAKGKPFRDAPPTIEADEPVTSGAFQNSTVPATPDVPPTTRP